MIRVAVLLVLGGTGALAEPLRPAELPPAGYAGLQYVDSKGCMFARAGNGSEVLWIPRVSRQGVAACGNPPSGLRAPVADDLGTRPVQATSTPAKVKAQGGYFVAVGSFGREDNANMAEARLVNLDYAVVRGRVQGGKGPLITVFAGPFPDQTAALAAQRALQEAGFSDAMLINP